MERGKIFKEAPLLAPKRSWFDMSNETGRTSDIGSIGVSKIIEMLPGDHLKGKTYSFGRVMPMLSPVFGKVNLFTYQFFVRNRDIWTNWDKYITDNDQSATWQQNQNFESPTMPFFSPLGGLVAQHTGFTISDFNANGSTFVWSYYDPAQYYFTLFETEDDINYNAVGTYPMSFALTPDYSEGIIRNHIIIVHKANYYEFGETDYWRSLPGGSNVYSDVERMKALNVYSPGTLLDEMGMCLTFPNFEHLVSAGVSEDYQEFHFHGFDFSSHFCVAMYILKYDSLMPLFCTDFITGVSGYLSSTNRLYEWVYDAAKSVITKFYNYTGEDPDIYGHMSYKTYSTLPVRAYNFIYNEYFRDQNWIAVDPYTDFSRDGSEQPNYSINNIAYWSKRRKAWEHDPYTTALPGPQRGEAVRFLSDAKLTLDAAVPSGTEAQRIINTNYSSQFGLFGFIGEDFVTTSKQQQLVVDLSAATIENFRWANAVQKYRERKARSGGRYYEYLIGIWDKEVPDSKLNRPIYLNGNRTPIQMSEVLQTSATSRDTDQPLGDIAGRGIAVGSDDYLDFEAPDYGFFVELYCIVPRVSYSSGVSPMWTRESYLDYPLPDFAQLGEQVVKTGEIFATGASVDNEPFGYQSRYYDWKYIRDEYSGAFRDTLDFWTWSRKFATRPVNGKKFLEVDSDYRQFAVTDKYQAHFLLSFDHDWQMNRPFPEFGVPVI